MRTSKRGPQARFGRLDIQRLLFVPVDCCQSRILGPVKKWDVVGEYCVLAACLHWLQHSFMLYTPSSHINKLLTRRRITVSRGLTSYKCTV